MLMNIENTVIQSIKTSLTFDNNKTKECEISVGDICSFEFNKNGRRKLIEGKVIKIFASDTIDSKSWYIIVDGSLDFAGQTERFCPNNILDVSIIQKHDQAHYISTPNDSTRITDMKLEHGRIMVSIDGGYSWLTPKIDVDRWHDDNESDSCNCGNNNHDHSCRHKHNKHKKPMFIEDDEEEDGDDVIEDENY